MAIPDFQTIMLPLLRLTADRAERTLIATVQAVADEFQLSPEERSQPLPHANQTTIYNRVAWASSYLRYALLLTSTGRGRFRITARAQTVLASPPQRIGIQRWGWRLRSVRCQEDAHPANMSPPPPGDDDASN